MKRDRKRLTVLAFLLFMTGLGYAAFSFLPPLFPNQAGPIPYQGDDITKITVKSKSRTQTIVREGAGFSVQQQGTRFRGDGEKIDRLIASFGKISKTTIVSDNKNNHGAFGIGPESITVFSKDKKIVLYVGSPEGQNDTFARVGEENQVFVAAALGTAPAGEDYRDLKPHLLDAPESVAFLSIERGREKVTLSKNKGAWLIGGRKANPVAVRSYLDSLASLPATDILAAPPAGLPALPFLKIHWNTAKGEGEVSFFEKDGETTVLTVPGSGYSYLIPRVYASTLLKGENDFLNE